MILKPAALLAAIVTLTFSGLVFAADPVNIEIMAVEEEPGRMVLTVSAVDENGKPFPGLGPSSFNAWINDQAVIVKQLHTAVDREPASVLLLIDVSGSMAGEPIQQAQVAINEFIDVLEPTDEVGVMAFSTGVNLLQDFTSDRDALDAAVANLTLTNDTALYDGVIEAASKMAGVDHSRKLIVLLSDGLANINQGARDSSIEAAGNAGVGFVAVSLGANTDRDYLVALADASGGSLIEAATPAELRQAYTSLAFAIRSQYTVVTEVPRSIDRTVAGTLKVHVIHRADNAFAERALGPLEGAFPPPFTMALGGINAGDKHNGAVELVPTVEEGIEVAKIDYFLDGEVVHTTQGVGGYTLDASLLENGSHVIKVVATDIEGREGEVQVPFLVPVLVAPSQGTSLPLIPILILLVLVGVAYVAIKFGRKRWLEITTPTYSRVDTWASIRKPNAGQKAKEWSEDDQSAHPLSRPATEVEPPDDVVQGRVVIMDEAAVRGGELETIREFEMMSLPLTFGSGPNADMRVDDAGGMIAAEEARVWVQRGRLVYHKLTTLSAMATEGVTAGWQFLDDGDELRIGPYRIIFQTQQPEPEDVDAEPLPDRLPQEHGMALHRSFGLTETDRSPDLKDWADREGPSPSGESPEAAATSLDEYDPPQAMDGPSVSSPTWESSLQSGAGEEAEEFTPAESSWGVAPDEPGSSEWEIGDDTSPTAGAWALEGANSSPQPAGDDSGPEDLAADGDEDSSSQPAEWGPTLLEPKSADWLVEQSEPVDGDIGHILQPDAWSGFVSGDDDDGSAAPENGSHGDDDSEPEERAWGT